MNFDVLNKYKNMVYNNVVINWTLPYISQFNALFFSLFIVMGAISNFMSRFYLEDFCNILLKYLFASHLNVSM